MWAQTTSAILAANSWTSSVTPSSPSLSRIPLRLSYAFSVVPAAETLRLPLYAKLQHVAQGRKLRQADGIPVAKRHSWRVW
jgi:hypothetical protein